MIDFYCRVSVDDGEDVGFVTLFCCDQGWDNEASMQRCWIISNKELAMSC